MMNKNQHTMDVTPCQTLKKSVLLRRTELLGDLPYMTSLPTYHGLVAKPRKEALSPESLRIQAGDLLWRLQHLPHLISALAVAVGKV